MSIEELQAENARLKAEVERLESMADENAHLHKGIYSLSLNVGQLKDEVERLRKAGDAMYESEIGYYGEQILEDMKHHSGELCRNWLAAKEGKPSV